MTLDMNVMAFWQNKLKAIGPRLTATDSHAKFIELLQDKIKNLGFNTIEFPFKINRCLQSSCSLENDSTKEKIPNLGPVPYSGITKEMGVKGEIRFFQSKHDVKMKGKVVVIKVKNFTIPKLLLMHQVAKYPRHTHIGFSIRHPLVAATLTLGKIQAAKDNGAVGVILVWEHISEDLANREVLPFTNSYLGIPSVWVYQTQLEALKRCRDRKEPVRLTLTGQYETNVTTKSFAVLVPGENRDKQILINTHTDGPNDIEENGAIALLTVLHAIKHDNLKFKNTLVFGFVSGHFQIPQSGIEGRQATSRFLRDLSMYETSQHLEMKKALGLTVEHLGGLDYVDSQKENKLIATELYDPLYVYASTKENRDLVLKSLSGTNVSGRYQILKPRKNAYFGEGQPLYQDGWPTISFIGMPLALCQMASPITEPDIQSMFDQTKLIFQILVASDHQF